jgi:hypothetical protein
MNRLHLIRAALLAALSFACLPSHATWDCMPNRVRSATVANVGTGYAWWCPIATNTTTGERFYKPNYGPVPTRRLNLARYAEASARVALADDPLAQARLELAAEPSPAPGSVDEYELRALRHAACLELVKPPHPTSMAPPSAGLCGAAPVPPQTSAAWVVAPAPATASPPGTRPTYRYTAPATLAVDGGRITQGAPCDCVIASYAPSNYTRYCSVQGVGTKVAVCVLKP